MNKPALETEIRNKILNIISVTLEEYGDVLPVSASEITIPAVDSEGNECFALIKVSIPRGTRNGNGGYNAYDGYAAAEEWKCVLAERADKAAKRKEKADREEKEKERKRAAKKLVKKLNTEGFDALVHQPPKETDDDTQITNYELNTMN